MSQFSVLKTKLRKLWEEIIQNEADLEVLDNEDSLNFLQELSNYHTNKKHIELYDSGFFQADVGNLLDITLVTQDSGHTVPITTLKGTKLPIGYSYSKDLTINLPENFIPFIKVIPEIRTVPNYELSLGNKFTTSRFNQDNDIIVIKGDNLTVYEGSSFDIDSGVSRINTLLAQFTEEERQENKIPLGNTKKVWEGIVEFTPSTSGQGLTAGKRYKLTGTVNALNAHFDVGTGCDGNSNIDIYQCLSFFERGGSNTAQERHDNEILGLTATTFSITARKTESRWVDNPPCEKEDSFFHGVSLSSSFSSTSLYTLTIVGALENITDSTFEGNNQSITISSSTMTIHSQTFEQIGVRAYYSSDTWGVLAVRETGEEDGNFLEELELDSDFLPTQSPGIYDDPPSTFPYTQITFNRNFGTFDREIFQTSESIQHTSEPILSYFKKGNNEFFITVEGTFLLVTPANKFNENTRQFPKYNDAYKVGTDTYDDITEDHSFVTELHEFPNIYKNHVPSNGQYVDTYLPEPINAEVRIRIILQNPLYWREKRQYDV